MSGLLFICMAGKTAKSIEEQDIQVKDDKNDPEETPLINENETVEATEQQTLVDNPIIKDEDKRDISEEPVAENLEQHIEPDADEKNKPNSDALTEKEIKVEDYSKEQVDKEIEDSSGDIEEIIIKK